MLFHFEFHRQGRWEAFGSGEGAGDGEAARIEALRDLIGLAGGTLPAGTYRCIAATSGSTRWEPLLLRADGQIRLGDRLPGVSTSIAAPRAARSAWSSPTARQAPVSGAAGAPAAARRPAGSPTPS